MSLITCRNLGSIGRVGNQLFTYVFVKAYAQSMGCDLHVGDWIGRKLFVNATEPLVTTTLPQTERDDVSKRPLLYFAGHRDIDINVFAQHQVYLNYYTRQQVRQWLTLKPEWERFAPHHGGSVMHLRKGDYVSNPRFRDLYCEVSTSSYAEACMKFHIPGPVDVVYDGWRPTHPEFLVNSHTDLSWLPDWLLMRDATHLLRANSTFSWWAATLGNGKVYSPVVGDKVGLQDCQFVEGNWPCTAGKFKNQSDLHLKP